MKRRDFLRNTALLAASTGVTTATWASVVAPVAADNATPSDGDTKPVKLLIASAPMLQNHAETSMGIAFRVSDLSVGFVSYSRKADMSDAQTVRSGGYRVAGLNGLVQQIRLTGLEPATTYYYRIGADRIQNKGGYNIKLTETVWDERTYTFTTAGAKAESHVCVINDTHTHWPSFARITEALHTLQPACVVWNGDIQDNIEDDLDKFADMYFCPQIERKDFAANMPLLLSPGNHEMRGDAGRQLERVWMMRQPEERAPRDWDLGRNYAVRQGDIALIGMDTAEDKLDENPRLAGVYNSAAYREAQVAWLRDALKRPEIAKAPFLVLFCHIPLFDDNPKCNPGDVHPDDDEKRERYDTNFAGWQRTCAQLWMPLLEKAGCQLVVSGHQHAYRYDAPTKERPWAQVVGGGPSLPDASSTSRGVATVIELTVVNRQLQLTLHNMASGAREVLATFKRR